MDHLSIQDRVDRVLAGLPAAVVTAHTRDQRLAVSNAGVFVLDTATPDAVITPGLAEQLASTTRSRLAERLRWVPFVDWFVVTDERPTSSQLPIDLLESTLLEGHSVDASTIRRIHALLELGELTPPWSPGLPDPLVPDALSR